MRAAVSGVVAVDGVKRLMSIRTLKTGLRLARLTMRVPVAHWSVLFDVIVFNRFNSRVILLGAYSIAVGRLARKLGSLALNCDRRANSAAKVVYV